MQVRRSFECALAATPGIYRKLLMWRGRTSPEKLAFLALVKRADVVMDIGANHGYFTLLFSDVVGARGRVLAFEPVPPTFRELERFVEGNRLYRNIILNDIACTDRTGEVMLYLPDSDSGQASLSSRHDQGSWAGVTEVTEHRARATCIDDFLADVGEVRIDFAKIDVEGAELMVLRGAEQTLRRAKPLLFLELCGSWTQAFGYRPADLRLFLRQMGYDVFAICGGQGVKLLNSDAEACVFEDQQGLNLIAGVAAKHSERIRAATR